MQQQEIIKSIKNYHTSGIIDDALIPYFDQDGKWRADHLPDHEDMLPAQLTGIRNAFLPASRRTRKCQSGTVLRTSFYWEDEGRMEMSYCGIDGSLILPNNTFLFADQLAFIGGHFITNTESRIHFPSLTEVGGDFTALQCFVLWAAGLRHVGGNVSVAGRFPVGLETIGGNLSLCWPYSVSAPCLRCVGGGLVANRCELLSAPVLEAVGGSMLLTRMNLRIDAPKLHTVGGDFVVSLASRIRAPSLRSVLGYMDTRSDLDFYHPDIKVEGRWIKSPGVAERWAMRREARLAMRVHRGPISL